MLARSSALATTFALAAALTGCRPPGVSTVSSETARGSSPAATPARTLDALLTAAANGPRWTPSMSATPVPETEGAALDETPDASGYIASPRSALRGGDDYIRLEDGPIGSFLVDLQAHLSLHDVAWLEGLARANGASTSGLTLSPIVRGPRTAPAPAAEATSDIATVRSALAAGAEHPVVQGYFASHGTLPVSVEWSDPDDVAGIDTLDVVITGLAADAAAALSSIARSPTSAPGTAVWRFALDGDAWRWRSWRWVDGGGYRDTLRALESVLDPPGADDNPFYHIVRPRDRWPVPMATVVGEEASPDGRWVARAIESDFVRIDSRDPESAHSLSAVEVVDRQGAVVGRPLEYWQGDGIGGHAPGIVRWRPDRDELIVADFGSGDGCVLHGGGSLWRYDPAADQLSPLPGSPSDAFDPTLRWLASVDVGRVAIHDIDTATVVSATFEAGAEYREAVWAPDSSAVVFTIVDEYRECADDRMSHLMRFDRADGRLTVLTHPAPGSWRVKRWHDDGTLEVAVTAPRMASGNGPMRTEWIDARSGAVEINTTTATTATTTTP